MQAQGFVGVILAAGTGSRLYPLTKHMPKPLLPICNKPIIQYQIDHLREVGIDKIFIVVGTFHDYFEEIVDCNASADLVIELVKQEQQLGIAHAVYTLKDRIDRPFLLLLGDTLIFPNPFPQMLKVFWKRRSAGVLAAQKESTPDKIRRNFAIITDKEGHVSKVIEKPSVAPTQLKGCGVYLFDQTIFDAIRRTPRTAMRDEYEITDSIQLFIEDGHRVDVWTGVEWEINLTEPNDLLTCNLEMLHRLRKPALIGIETSLPKDVQVIHSVIGARVTITNCKAIINSVILDDTFINERGEINNVIVTNMGTIKIKH